MTGAPAPLDNLAPQLARAWHPVATAAALDEAARQDRPLRVRLLGADWVLARLDGELAAFPDLCPHRRVPLSGGRVVGASGGRRLECPYHGWQFDAAGSCTAVPALGPGAAVPRGMRTRSAWGTRERYGLIWLAPDEPLVGIPELAECDDDRYAWALLPPRRTAACAGVLLDNFFDVAHFSYLHPSTFGIEQPVTTGTATVGRDGWQARLTHRTTLDQRAGGRWRTATYTATAPLAMHLHLSFADEPDAPGSMVAFVTQPEDEGATVVYKLVACPRADGPEALAAAVALEIDVLEEDIEMVERIRPQHLPLDTHAELHTRADRASVTFRRLLAEFCAAAGRLSRAV